MLHVPREYDYRYLMNRRDDFVKLFKLRHLATAPHQLLKFYEIVTNHLLMAFGASSRRLANLESRVWATFLPSLTRA